VIKPVQSSKRIKKQEVIQMQNAGQPEKQERLRNQWEPNDPRMNGCIELSGKMADILECAQSGSGMDNLKCEELYKPLELAEAMREAASKIELLTEQEKVPDEEAEEEYTH